MTRVKHRTSAGSEVGFDPEAELKRDVIRLLVTCDKMSLYFGADAELGLIFFPDELSLKTITTNF